MADETVNVELIIEAGKTAQTLGEVRQSIKDVRAALDEVPIGTKAFEDLLEVSRKNREMVKSMRQEYAGLKQVGEIGKVLTGSFAAATASMSLLAGENEKLEEGLRKTQAAFVLLAGVKELATAFRAAAIENKGLNASLLTNPYVLVAAVIAAVAVGIYTFANKQKDATAELKKFNEVSLQEVNDEIKKITDAGEKELVNLRENTKLLEIQKAGIGAVTAAKVAEYNKEIEIAKDKVAALSDEKKALAQNVELNKQQVKHNEELIKQNEDRSWDDKLWHLVVTNSTVGSSIEVFKKLNEQLQDNIKTGSEYQKIIDDSAKAEIKATDDIKNSYAELAQKKKEDREKAAKDLEVKGLEKVKQGLEDIISTNAHYLQIEKELGATELQTNAQAVKNNENEAKHIADKIAALGQIKKRDKEQEEAYQALLEMQKKNIEQNETLIAQGVKLNSDDATKKELANLEAYKIVYEGLVKTEEAAYKAKQAAGATETTLSQLREDSFNKEMQYLKTEIATIEASNISEEEKKKKIDEVNLKITELSGNFKVLNAEIAQYNKLHFFTADQQKEINTAETYIGKVQSSIAAMGKAATALAQQEADKRIAIYKAENDAEQASLSNRLQLGLLTQAQYDAQKKAADDKLKQEEADAKKKAFVINKAFSIEQAIVSTALAVMNALATPLPFPAPEIFAAAAGATGAVEIATIAASQPPAMATGGIFNDGGSVAGVGTGTSDSINARLSNGESVINAKSTAAFAPLLSAINQVGGGVAFKGQPKQNNVHPPASPSSAPEASATPQRVYVTEYDITRTQNKVAVIQNRSTF